MSTAAAMLVKDEADIVGVTLAHLFTQVDHVFVADNGSTDGTSDILAALAAAGAPLDVLADPEPGYFQSEKTTALAMLALARGHDWIIPCDADEVWYSPFGRVGDVLGELGDEWLFASAVLRYHVPTSDDPPNPNPVERLGWRFAEPQGLPKVACRLSPDLTIEMGNHGAHRQAPRPVNSSGSPPTIAGRVEIRHFPWRTEEQHLRKIRNGAAAYAAAGDKIDSRFGEHWRQWDGEPDEAINGWYRMWAFQPSPAGNPNLIYDPAPIGGTEGAT